MGSDGAKTGHRRARRPRQSNSVKRPSATLKLTARYIGAIMGPQNWHSDWRCAEGPLKMDNVPLMGANPHVSPFIPSPLNCRLKPTRTRNPTAPRLASSSKDGTVRVWSTLTRRSEFTLGGHTASVNVVKWGGSGGGVLYTGSSDRTVRVWSTQDVRCSLSQKQE